MVTFVADLGDEGVAERVGAQQPADADVGVGADLAAAGPPSRADASRIAAANAVVCVKWIMSPASIQPPAIAICSPPCAGAPGWMRASLRWAGAWTGDGSAPSLFAAKKPSSALIARESASAATSNGFERSEPTRTR